MGTSPHLLIPEIDASQNQKEVPANNAFTLLDRAMNESAPIDMTGNAVALTVFQFTRTACFECSGQTAAATLTIPAGMQRVFRVNNLGAAAVTVAYPTGAGAIVAPGSMVGLLANGTIVSAETAAVPDVGSAVTYADLPAELAFVPLAFMLPGKPDAGSVFNLVLPFACTLPAALAGAVVYAGALATADAVFTLNHVVGATVTAIGSVTITSASHTSATLAAAALTMFAAGDVLQLLPPATQDATLANIGITLLAARV